MFLCKFKEDHFTYMYMLKQLINFSLGLVKKVVRVGEGGISGCGILGRLVWIFEGYVRARYV